MKTIYEILNLSITHQKILLPEIIANKTTLDLSHRHLTPEQLDLFADILLEANAIQKLHLFWCRFNKQHLYALGKIIQLRTLKILNLACNNLTDDDLEFLLPFFKKSTLFKLHLNGNYFTSTVAISRILKNSKIKYLTFSSCEKIASFHDLCEALPNSSLEVLDLRYNWHESLDEHLGHALQKSPKLHTLMLNVNVDKTENLLNNDNHFIKNLILERSPNFISLHWNKIAENNKIEYLNLEQDDIDDEKLHSLTHTLSPTSRLWGLELKDNPVSIGAISYFLEHTKANNLIYLSAGKSLSFQNEKLGAAMLEALSSIAQSILKRGIVHFSYISQIKSGWGLDAIEDALLVNQNTMVEMRLELLKLIKDFIENKYIPPQVTEQIINNVPFCQLPAFDSETAQVIAPFKPAISQRLFEIYKSKRLRNVPNDTIKTLDNKFTTMAI